MSRRSISRLECYLEENGEGIWENSWVRFPPDRLGPLASLILDEDLRADKSDPASAYRTDAGRCRSSHNGCESVHVPISYLVKLALADALDCPEEVPTAIRATGLRV